jgi:hypothetical protein
MYMRRCCLSVLAAATLLGASASPAASEKPGAHATAETSTDPLVAAQEARLRKLRSCRSKAKRHARREVRRARRLSGVPRTTARGHARRHLRKLRARCLERYGRKPGKITGLVAQPTGPTSIQLSWPAVGTDGGLPPPARGYLVKQSLRPIRTARDFRRAQTLCEGSCNFRVTSMFTLLSLVIGDLQQHTTYYYAVAGRDNVSCRLGPRTGTVKATTGPVTTHGPHIPVDPQTNHCKF